MSEQDMGIGELPTDLDLLMEAASAVMGEEFATALESAGLRHAVRMFYKGWKLGLKVPYPVDL